MMFRPETSPRVLGTTSTGASTRLQAKRSRKKNSSSNNEVSTWRIFGIQVHPDDIDVEAEKSKENDRNSSLSVPVEKRFVQPVVLEALRARLKLSEEQKGVLNTVRVVRRSLDARRKGSPRFVYVLDVDLPASISIRHQPGRNEKMNQSQDKETRVDLSPSDRGKTVVIVGAGPAGLFCALQLAQKGHTPIVLERGQPVEIRGRDIGALIHRRSLDSESNFAFGEGGAGTWSDGKLTTRIGRNSESVRYVLETLCELGAPDNILLEGSPHLGTDNLVRILRNLRFSLQSVGGEVRFGAKVTGLHIQNGKVLGVNYNVTRSSSVTDMLPATSTDHLVESYSVYGDAVVLATGHSARDMYESLHKSGVVLEPKGFACGFRIEHPQKLITKIQYGDEWGPSVVTGRSRTDNENLEFFAGTDQDTIHTGRLPVPSYRLATDKANDGARERGAYSFCMCPGGQIVPASTDPKEVCVNGMSFSKRDSLWANSALVVTVDPDDEVLDPYRQEFGVLAGIEFQREMERRAAKLGGGDLVVPVQRVTDFIKGIASTSAPPSSYRLGVKPAACHEIYPPSLTNALRHALVHEFDRQMPGFVSEEGLLHGVETRTSSPVRICRDRDTYQAIGLEGLFPAGEGAGFAGGIVSAAVDGCAVGEAIVSFFGGSALEPRAMKNQNVEGFY